LRPRFAKPLFALFAGLVLTTALDVSGAGSTPVPSPSQSIDSVDSLFSVLARSPGFFARFHEEKQIALLVAPLKSDGTIHFDKQRGLARHTLSPQKQSVLLSGSTLTLWDGTKTETVPLQSSAPLRALAEAFSLLLAADRASLEKSFSLRFQASGQSWRLALVPTLADLKKLVSEVDVAGEALTPKTLVVREASGDESSMALSDVDLARRYTDREAAALFKAPPSPL
jgi:hypothetical protein